MLGSRLDNKFVVDTIFVVRDTQPFILRQPPDIDEAFRVCTVESLLTDADCGGEKFVLYRGATYGDPINGMYSFVPCRRADSAERRFARAPILDAGCLLGVSFSTPPLDDNRRGPGWGNAE